MVGLKINMVQKLVFRYKIYLAVQFWLNILPFQINKLFDITLLHEIKFLQMPMKYKKGIVE